MKRTIQRTAAINCGETTCGKCRWRKPASSWCEFWNIGLDFLHVEGRSTIFARCDACKAAEVKKP